jgi:hypothetical protein
MAKLTGNVDPAKVIEYAPGAAEEPARLRRRRRQHLARSADFDAYQIGGSYVKGGTKRMIAQKTVVIPGQDALFVLQLNADGLEDQMGPLMNATTEIDEKTTITP